MKSLEYQLWGFYIPVTVGFVKLRRRHLVSQNAFKKTLRQLSHVGFKAKNLRSVSFNAKTTLQSLSPFTRPPIKPRLVPPPSEYTNLV